MTTYATFVPTTSVSGTATSTSSIVQLPVAGISGQDTLRVVNAGASVAYVKLATKKDSPVADINSIAILPGVIEIFDVSEQITQVALFAPSGSVSVNFTVGVGA